MSLPHVLLGLLSRAPGSGWDLRSRLVRDPSFGWEAELAQIYPALERLRRAGFVRRRRQRSPKGPARRVYRLTPSGRREFRNWLAEPLVLPRSRDATLARLAFLERQTPEERVARLTKYRDLVAGALRYSASGSTGARRRRRALLETELAWADAEAAIILTGRPRS